MSLGGRTGRLHFAAFEARDVAALVAALSDPAINEDDQHRVIHYLSQLADDRSTAALATILRESHSTTLRTAAARGLGGRRGPCVMEALRAGARDHEHQVRAWSVASLAAGGHHGALGAIRGALEDPHRDVRAFAARALGEMADIDAIHQLESALADRSSLVATNAERALEAIGTPEAVAAVERASTSARGLLRRRRLSRRASRMRERALE